MARPRKDVAEATHQVGASPIFSVAGFGTGFDRYSAFVPELYGVDLIRDMFLMADTDETVGAMMFCINSTMQQIDWSYVPQVDGLDAPEDAEAKRYADLTTSMFADMDTPFDQHVEDAMTMLWAGFAPVEIVMKQRDGVNSRFNDRFYGIDTLNLIDQTTVWDWKYEGSKPVALKQIGFNIGGDGLVPLSKTLLYRTSAQYNNPRGRPLLKSAWRVWRLKRKVQDSEAIGIERELCGLPIFEMPEEVIQQQFETDQNGGLTDDAKRAVAMVSAAKSATQDMRFNKSGGLVMPSDTWGDDIQGGAVAKRYNFKIQTSGGQRAIDVRTTARDYDHAIARVAMMQFLTLGQRSGGSYSLSDDQSSMAVASIMSLARKVVTEWNAKTIPMIWTVNAWPDKYRPRLRHSDVNKNGIVQLGQFLGGLGKAADLWGGDLKMREGLAKAANLPFDHDSQTAAADSAIKAAALAATLPKPAVAAPSADAGDAGD